MPRLTNICVFLACGLMLYSATYLSNPSPRRQAQPSVQPGEAPAPWEAYVVWGSAQQAQVFDYLLARAVATGRLLVLHGAVRAAVGDDVPVGIALPEDEGDPFDDSVASDLPLDVEIDTEAVEPSVIRCSSFRPQENF